MDKLNIILETFEALQEKGAIDEGLYLSSCNALKDIASGLTRQQPERAMTAREVDAALGLPPTDELMLAAHNQRLAHSEEFKDLLHEHYRIRFADRFQQDEATRGGLKDFWRTVKNWMTENNTSTRKAMWKCMRYRYDGPLRMMMCLLEEIELRHQQIGRGVVRGLTDPTVLPEHEEKIMNSIFGRAARLQMSLGRWFCIHRNYKTWRKTGDAEGGWNLKTIGLSKEQTKDTMRKVNVWAVARRTPDCDPADRSIRTFEWSFWTDRIQLGRMYVVDRIAMRMAMETIDEHCKKMDEKPLRCPYRFTHPDLETVLKALRQCDGTGKKNLDLVTSGVSGKTVGQHRCYEGGPQWLGTGTANRPMMTMEFAEVWNDKKKV
jgi:hypothetical protein